MIKFFRKIRYDLMGKNKTGKYFKYAIGEIVLVVIGILIALNINTWNNNRIERIKERNLLDNLHEDFLLNKALLDSVKVVHLNHLKIYNKIKSYFPVENYITFNDTISKYENNITYLTFDPNSGTVNSVLNSGNLNIIQNDTLQRYLTKWQDVKNDYLEEEEHYWKFLWEQYWPFFQKEGDMFNKNALTESASLRVFQNRVLMRLDLLNSIADSYVKEPIEFYIDEIIRLSKPEK
jgi:hypothetical protein